MSARPELKVITNDNIDELDWLWTLDTGTVFLCKTKYTHHYLDLWKITFKAEQEGRRAVKLENPNGEEAQYVDSHGFSRSHILHILLGIGGSEDGASDTMVQV